MSISIPAVSVILPVYNGEKYVSAAIFSILEQTFVDFEFIIIDDGSTDRTTQIVEGFKDPRIIFIRQHNAGLSLTLNRGIELARGKYVARQDHDDVSLPTRLEKQVKFLDQTPDCALLGTWSEIWEGDIPTKRGHRHPTDMPALRLHLLFDNYFVHSSVMFRRDVVNVLGGYKISKDRGFPEDFELWSRISRHHGIANLPDPLIIYRELPESISRNSSFVTQLMPICIENLAWASERTPSDPQICNIVALWHRQPRCLKAKLDFAQMTQVIYAAAFLLDGKVPEGTASLLVPQFVGTLRKKWLALYFDALPLWLQRSIKRIRERLTRRGA